MLKALINTTLLYLLLSSSAFANAEFSKVGEGRMEYLFWDVYDATLYTPSGDYVLGEHPVKFKLTYLRDFEAKEIVKATNEQWELIGKEDLVNKYDKQLLSLWPNISKGDSLTLITDEQGKSTFFFNDEKVGVIDDIAFSSDFLAIWLAENTSEPALRKKLLGN
jgi:hypothetical protein